MDKKFIIYNLLDVLISAEKLKDEKAKEKDTSLTGENSTLYHLKRLREMIKEELN